MRLRSLLLTIVLIGPGLVAHFARAAEIVHEPVPLVHSRACGGFTLEALPTLWDGPSAVLLRQKNNGETLLGTGFADFSPDCKHVWFLDTGAPDERTGSARGYFIELPPGVVSEPVPAGPGIWRPDSRGVIFTTGPWFELFESEVAGAHSKPFFKPTDATPCALFGDGVDWTPPMFVSNDILAWTYAVSVPEGASPDQPDGLAKPAKRVFIEWKSGKVVRQESTTLQCEYYRPAPHPRGRKASKAK